MIKLNKSAQFFAAIKGWLGAQAAVSHAEQWLSASAGLFAMLLVSGLSGWLLGSDELSGLAATGIIASIGATCVLVFAVPHGPLSQPWPVLGGHIVSAFVGVSCALWLSPIWLAASLAVGLSILAMFYLRCLHPPGGATALIAVVGGDAVHQLGYQFLLMPVLLNVLVVLAVAVGLNWVLHTRRYPAVATKAMNAPIAKTAAPIAYDEFIEALRSVDSFVDVHEADIKRIFAIAAENAESSPQLNLEVGGVYSNGLLGREWAMRQIVSISSENNPQAGWITYVPVSKSFEVKQTQVSYADFVQWARFEMEFKAGHWHRLVPSDKR